VGFLPVLGDDDEVVGVVTDRDLVVRALALARPLDTPVAEVMTGEVMGCRPRDDLRRAEEVMVANRKSRIPILDDAGHCVGVVSLTDVAQAESARRAGEVLEGVTRREAARLRA
jgi:CBS domain-containing protein